MPSNIASQSVSMDVTQPDFNHQQQPQPSSQITGNASEEQFCKHAQYTLKETYSDYQEALADYNMLFDRTTDHQAEDSPCRFHEPSSQKLSRDKRRMQEIINEFERQMPPKELTDQEKLDKIQYSIDSLEEELLWDLSKTAHDKLKKMYDQHMELKKQYDSGKITLNEYYEKFRSIKYE